MQPEAGPSRGPNWTSPPKNASVIGGPGGYGNGGRWNGPDARMRERDERGDGYGLPYDVR